MDGEKCRKCFEKLLTWRGWNLSERRSDRVRNKEGQLKVIEIDPELRHRRQLIENIQHNTMTAMETARALQKELIRIGWRDIKPGLLSTTGHSQGTYGAEYVTKLAKMVGKSERIREI